MNTSTFAVPRPMCLVAAFAAALICAGGCKPKGAAGGPAGGFATQVVAVKAVREAVSENLRVVGTVLANETVDLQPEVEGRVTAIHFEEGQKVEADALLVELESGHMEAMLKEAEANLALAEGKWTRAVDLLQNKTMAKQESEEAEAQFNMTRARVEQMREQLRYRRLKAPFAGVIGARRISPGQVIAKTTVIATLSDLDPVKIEGNVPERFLATAKEGAKFALTIAAFPQEKFEGELYFVGPHIDPVNRTALVKARVANPELRLKPGMFASADLTLRVKDDAIVIPEASLMPQGDSFAVIVVDAALTAQMRPVKPGVRMAGRVEILEGLKEGETVVVEGWQKTRPGGKVTLAPPEKAAAYTAAAK